MKCYYFTCEGRDSAGYPSSMAHEYIDETEEQARRGLIHTLNHLYKFYPQRIKLVESKEWAPSPFDWD